MSVLFFLVSIWGGLFTLNAMYPVRRNKLLFGPSFFASWMTIELAGHHLLWQGIATVVFVLLGALDHWIGWVGLAITVLSWIGLLVIMRDGRRTAQRVRAALGGMHEEGDREEIPFTRILFPFHFSRRGVVREKNITYARAGGRELKLDIYRPENVTEKHPAVLQIHGGGWVIGDKREQGIPLLNHLAANGWVGFNANYRLSPTATWPDHLVDLKRAVVWIREHADEYGVDPDFIAVTGGSAGGHLTAMMGLTADDPTLQPGFEDADTSVQAAVPFYGVFDFTDRQGVQVDDFLSRFLEPIVMKAFIADEPEKFTAASPIDRVNADAPPFFVIHGDRDTLAPLDDARLFVERLREASDEPVVYAELQGAQHAFDIFYSMRSTPVFDAVERFLEKVRIHAQEGGPDVIERDIVVEARAEAAGEGREPTSKLADEGQPPARDVA
jgi:acetyl esterase/lipase